MEKRAQAERSSAPTQPQRGEPFVRAASEPRADSIPASGEVSVRNIDRQLGRFLGTAPEAKSKRQPQQVAAVFQHVRHLSDHRVLIRRWYVVCKKQNWWDFLCAVYEGLFHVLVMRHKLHSFEIRFRAPEVEEKHKLWIHAQYSTRTAEHVS